MPNMFNILGTILFAASAGGFYFQNNNKILAIYFIIVSFLFAIGYFDPEKKNKKRVM